MWAFWVIGPAINGCLQATPIRRLSMFHAMILVVLFSSTVETGGLGLFKCLERGHHRACKGSDDCRSCLEDAREVAERIAIMQRHPSWRKRDGAARDLRDYDWHRHPELAPALAASLLNDPHEEVREEAAESLSKLAPCDPSAHVALRQAAIADPDHATRKWARRGLERLEGRCLGDCLICGPAPAAPASIVVNDPIVPGLAPPPVGIERGVPIETPYGFEFGPFEGPILEWETPTDLAPLPEPFPTPFERRDSYRPVPPSPTAPPARPGLLPPALAPGGPSLAPPIEVAPPVFPEASATGSPFGPSNRVDVE